MSAPMASPKLMACSMAARFTLGKVPGRPKSMRLAWLLGSAPKAVLEPENILEAVVSCTCTSRPITVSHSIIVPLLAYGFLGAIGWPADIDAPLAVIELP